MHIGFGIPISFGLRWPLIVEAAAVVLKLIVATVGKRTENVVYRESEAFGLRWTLIVEAAAVVLKLIVAITNVLSYRRGDTDNEASAFASKTVAFTTSTDFTPIVSRIHRLFRTICPGTALAPVCAGRDRTVRVLLSNRI